jgi:Xaa-Pro aminopeptidase
VDDVGLGNGQMAAAARVRPGGESGVQVDDYADKPIKLATVVRKIK